MSATISTVYIMDSYRPIAGETIVSKMGFKGREGLRLMSVILTGS